MNAPTSAERGAAAGARFRVEGRRGPLRGRIDVPGCKNSAMPALAAAALAPGDVTVHQVPAITDIHNLLEILRILGVEHRWEGHAVTLAPAEGAETDIPAALSRKLRGSVYALAVPAVRGETARIGPIGGDLISGRSLEPHARALTGFGLQVHEAPGGWIVAGGPARPREFILRDRGISATGLAILIAASLDGRSVIREASIELETDDILGFVRALGAEAHRDGRTLVIRGPLAAGPQEITVPPDHLVWGTFAVAAAITGGEFTAQASVAPRAGAVLEVLQAAGVRVMLDGVLRTEGAPRRALRVETGDFPEFPSDLLPQFMALATQAEGMSELVERIYDHRFDHAAPFRALGARLEVTGRSARVWGPSPLTGTAVHGSGIRESTALVLAALAAEGTTEISGAASIHRGYEDLAADLRSLGADVRSVSDADAEP